MALTNEVLKSFKERFNSCKTNKIVAASVAKVGLHEASTNHEVYKRHNFQFSDVTKKGEITNQKSSGRCWMFSALNVARVSTMEKLNIKSMEYSQTYTLFWDKLEKANFFLESIIETLDEKTDSRVVSHLLTAPVQDGGQWDMFRGLLEKYGIVPKEIMPETFHSSNTRDMEAILTKYLRKAACDMRNLHKAGKSLKEIEDLKNETLYTVYNILTKCLGEIPETFTYEYRDKDEKFHRISNITPKEFFDKYVGWNLKDKISLINAPTDDKPYGKVYTVKFLGTVKEADKIKYLNVPIEVLKESAIKSIKAGEPVWFGCDVIKFLEKQKGIMDLDMFLYDDIFPTLENFTKAERLDYHESVLTHAMVFTGVNLDENGKPLEWQVENSWGDAVGDKGIFSMTDEWFDEYNYEVMVDKKYVDEKWLKALDEEIVELEPWDPFGALARLK